MRLGNPAARTPSPIFSDPGQDRDPAPPRWEVLELIRLGAIVPGVHRLPALERCLCGHQPQVHVEILLPFRELGVCTSKPCRKRGWCTGYELDPRFAYVPGSQGHAVKLQINEDGTMARVVGPDVSPGDSHSPAPAPPNAPTGDV